MTERLGVPCLRDAAGGSLGEQVSDDMQGRVVNVVLYDAPAGWHSGALQGHHGTVSCVNRFGEHACSRAELLVLS